MKGYEERMEENKTERRNKRVADKARNDGRQGSRMNKETMKEKKDQSQLHLGLWLQYLMSITVYLITVWVRNNRVETFQNPRLPFSEKKQP